MQKRPPKTTAIAANLEAAAAKPRADGFRVKGVMKSFFIFKV
jgi:hypothetical protein